MAGFYSARVSTKLPLHRPGLSPPCTVVGGVLDLPVISDGDGSAGGGDGGAGEVEGGLGGGAPEAGAGAAGEDVTLDADDGADEGGPLGIGEGVGGVKDGDAALLLPITPAIAAADVGERCSTGAEILRLLVRGWLVVLELYDRVDLGICAGFECLLWQCRASSVTR